MEYYRIRKFAYGTSLIDMEFNDVNAGQLIKLGKKNGLEIL